VVAGALAVLAGRRLADPIVGLLITTTILVVLRGAARDICRLMDAVDPNLVAKAEAALAETSGDGGRGVGESALHRPPSPR